jgi:hypothetical protein
MSTVEETIQIPRRTPVLEGVRRRCRNMWMAALDRGPSDYDETVDERRLMMNLLRELARNQRPGPGSSSGQKHPWVINTMVAIVVALSAWNLKATLENTTAIAVLQCQVNPQSCPQVQVNRGINP